MDRFLIKRRRVDDSGASTAAAEAAVVNHLTVLPKQEENHLTDLPKEALIHVAKFLATPSSALFAATLDGSLGSSDENVIFLSAIFPSNQLIGSSSSSSNYSLREILAQLAQSHVQKILLKIEDLNSYALSHNSTYCLDFGNIKKEYVRQLCDDDINAVLFCIDAVNTLKGINLANCINITGVGLEPLRGSTIIEQIDLSLVRDGENPQSLDPEPLISCDSVLPILDSIISQDGCTLKHLEFPYKWRRAQGQRFESFVTRYNQLLKSRVDVSCGGYGCNNLPPQEEEWMDAAANGRASQQFTCYDCLEHYCERCIGPRYCSHCEKLICGDCQAFDSCERCHDIFCVDCTVEMVKCSTSTCDFARCKNCVYGELKSCSTCDAVTCRECSGFGRCFECNEYLCSDKGGCVEKYDCVHCEKRFCSTCASTCLNACENNCSYYFCNECSDV